MNRIPEMPTAAGASRRLSGGAGRRWLAVLSLAAAAGCSLVTSFVATADDEPQYRLRFTVTPQPDEHGARVELVLAQDRYLLREMSMEMPAARFRDVSGAGEVANEDGRVTWRPPEGGGTLEWFVDLRHRRTDDAYDAYIDSDWALFRATDVIPAARTRTLKGAISDTSIAFDLPRGWSSTTQYFGRNHEYEVDNPDRRYARPTGWILLGDIGTRVEEIADVRFKVTGPAGHAVRRLDIVALMHWTLPQFRRLLPDFPERLTIFSAASPMWRGGLSGPRSLFLHADLPLISENGTSTVLHEIMHVATELVAAPGADWIVEGIAEYYSMEMLRRSRSVSNERFRDALAGQRDWGEDADTLCDGPSTGAMTARAVGVMADLDAELRDESDGRSNLDDLLRELVSRDDDVTVGALRDAAEDILGSPAGTLSSRRLPGCD